MRMLTIGQLAGYAGVTVRAVRHYHKRGLLDEPARDASGYRRYTAEHAIELVKIKTLADAGVPLGLIKELRAAGREQFASTIERLDRKLEDQIADLTRMRRSLGELAAGERLFVPEAIANYLDHLRSFGVSERTLEIERDGWILQRAVSPETADTWLAAKLDALADPEARRLYLDYDKAFDADPDDPSLREIAARMAEITVARYGNDTSAWANTDAEFSELLKTAVTGQSLAWDKIGRLALEQIYQARRSNVSTK